MKNLKKIISILGMILLASVSQQIFCAEDYKQSSDYINANEYEKIVCAIGNSDLDTVKSLVQFVDVNSCDKDGDIFLHLAIAEGNVEIVSYLISCGADVNLQNNEGDTSLHCLVEVFLSEFGIACANYAACVIMGDSSVVFADFLNESDFAAYVKISKLLVDAGANPYMKNSEGVLVLDYIVDLEVELFQGQMVSDLDKGLQKFFCFLQDIRTIMLQSKHTKPEN